MFKEKNFRNWNQFSRKQKLSKNVSSVFKRVWSFRKAWTSLQFVVLICLIGVFFYIWPEKKNKQIPTTFFFFLLFKGFCVNVNVNLSFPQLEKNFPFQYSPQNRKRKKKKIYNFQLTQQIGLLTNQKELIMFFRQFLLQRFTSDLPIQFTKNKQRRKKWMKETRAYRSPSINT